MQKYLKKFLILFSISICLNSCSNYRCNVEGIILIRQKPIASNKAEIGWIGALIVEEYFIYSEVTAITPHMVEETINELNLKDKNGQTLSQDEFINNLQIELLGGTDLIRFSYNHRNRQKSAKIVNSLMANYVKSVIKKQIFLNLELLPIEKYPNFREQFDREREELKLFCNQLNCNKEIKIAEKMKAVFEEDRYLSELNTQYRSNIKIDYYKKYSDRAKFPFDITYSPEIVKYAKSDCAK